MRGTRPAAAFKNEKDIDGLWDIAILDAKSLGEPSKPPFDKFQVSIKDSLKKVVATLILPPLPQPDAAKDSETPKEEPKKETNRSIKMTAPRWSDLTLSGKATTKELLGKTASDSTPDKSEASDVGVALLSMALIGTGDNPSLLVGTIQLPDGTQWTVRGTKGPLDEQSKEDKNKDTKKDDEKKEKQAALHTTMRYPMASFGLESIPEQPNVLVVQNTTLWTGGPAGLLRDADMIVRNGKIEAIGIDLPVPEGATIIDGSKYEVSPGLIDCHSHMATDSGVNEGTQAVTAEVRIGDFINAEDITIYRQLAGGLTSANILHGSANPIGGQNQVIKLRWGRPYEELKFQGAPAGVKFALGENVKQSNWTDTSRTRYPQSRMGVEQLFRDRFNAAKQYDSNWKQWNLTPKGLPPRRDLELDAIAEILRGERWIHCHSYRQDEILALIRVCDEYGIKIGSLQHILEGYKVAEAIAKHGATASSFSDWWAYKLEVYDAIPYNGALMHQQGIVVSFNSDDAELGRHMNHEAAKAVKYGGVDPHSALQFVTLNPAKQLRIDKHVGSLEVGKDADFVLWSGSPLSVRSRCEQTWIDGR
ncbi:MAG: amidohydrolase, partial [Pirellula sp.]